MPSENILWLVVKVCGSVTCNYCVRIDCSDKQRYIRLGCENYSSSNVPTPKEGIGIDNVLSQPRLNPVCLHELEEQ